MKNRNGALIIINIACIIALIVVIIPLLMLAKYNFPSADDWSYGACTYNVLQNGGGVREFIQASFDKTVDTWLHVEGKFVGAFFATLQPGIWGEQYYVVVPWLFIGSIIFSEMYFFKFVLCKDSEGKNRMLWIPIVVPAIILQMLYCPAPSESFYWYTGAMSYTGSFALSLVLLVLYQKQVVEKEVNIKFVLRALLAGGIAFIIGGMNFGTSLSCFLTLCVLSGLCILYNKKGLARTWYIVALSGISLALSILAPGNTSRISSNFGGETGSPIEAVVMSLVRSATNIYSWTNIKGIIMLLFIIPFVWKCVKNIGWEFKYPVVFTILTFGLYASQCTATMYVDGTTGGGRMSDVLFYSYYVWLLVNMIYWLGWLNTKQNKVCDILNDVQNKFKKFLLPYCACLGALIVCIIFISDCKEITAYRAYRDWRQGWAQQYAREWEKRLEILHDDSVTVVEFLPVSISPEFYVYTDLQEADGYIWVNQACASYYGKESIAIVEATNLQGEQ